MFLLVACGRSSTTGEAGKVSRSSFVDGRPSPIVDKLPQPKGNDVTPVRVTPPSEHMQKPAKGEEEQSRARLDSNTDWALIAATYKSYEAAQRRANSLRAEYGGCACSVYPRKGEGQNYYVIVGSNLTREAADQKLEQARTAGLPEDSYVTRLVARKATTDEDEAERQ
jgi:hypothetical protein